MILSFKCQTSTYSIFQNFNVTKFAQNWRCKKNKLKKIKIHIKGKDLLSIQVASVFYIYIHCNDVSPAWIFALVGLATYNETKKKCFDSIAKYLEGKVPFIRIDESFNVGQSTSKLVPQLYQSNNLIKNKVVAGILGTRNAKNTDRETLTSTHCPSFWRF